MQSPNSHKLRMTSQRQAILDELRRIRAHPTADEVHKAVRARLPRISLGTVYRNLELMAATGVIQRLNGGLAQRRYDWENHPHFHVCCTDCGRVQNLDGSGTSVDYATARSSTGFDIREQSLMLHGRCPDCRGSEASGERVEGNED